MTGRLPLAMWGAIISCTAMSVGWNWDISWHRSIGRDTPWSAPHIAVYIALLVAFLYNAEMVISYTFGRHRDKLAIKQFGFRAPAGAFMTLWGILLQFTAILFDLWWHDSYGLDLGIFSAPHYAIMIGVSAFYAGQILLVISLRNTRFPESDARTKWFVLVLGGIGVGSQFVGLDPTYGPRAILATTLLISTAAVVPSALTLIQAYLRWKWAGAVAAAVYMGYIIAEMQIFMLFPATPKFGPVYHELPHFLPPAFPMPLVVPALLMGLVIHVSLRNRKHPHPLVFVVAGLVFVVGEWVSNYLLVGLLESDLARNRIFAGHLPGSAFQDGFTPVDTVALAPSSLGVFGLCVLLASGAAVVGYVAGTWLRRVVR